MKRGGKEKAEELAQIQGESEWKPFKPSKGSQYGRIYARTRMVVCGEVMRVNLYPVRKVAAARSAKRKPSRAAQVELNRRNAENRAKDIAHLNFPRGSGTIWVRLDYDFFVREAGRNPSREEAQKMAKAYLRVLRREYEKRGAEFKWMNWCQVGRTSGKIHHHMLLSGLPKGMMREDIEALWKHGYGNVVGVKYRNGSIAGLVAYSFRGCDVFRSCSRNCKRPQEEPYEDGTPASIRVNDRMISMRDARYIDDNPDDITFIRKLFTGYEVSYVRKSPELIADEHGLGMIPFAGPFVEIELYRSEAGGGSALPKWLRKREAL